MEFLRRPPAAASRLALFPGAFNPPTRAHLALARAALERVDEVAFVLPRVFPHKPYEGATLEQRARLLELALAGEPGFSIAVSGGGLFIEIAREAREIYGPDTELYLLCGSDAAERIVGWDYGDRPGIQAQLREYRILVGRRGCAYAPPEHLCEGIHAVAIEAGHDEVAASTVRAAMECGDAWEHLVPPEIVAAVREIYAPAR